MNKILIFAIVAISVMFAGNPKLEKMLLERTGENIKVIKEVPMQELKNMKLVVLETAQQQMVFLANDSNDTIIALDSTFLTGNQKTLQTITKEIQEAQIASAKSTGDKIIKAIKANKYPIISLKSPANTKKTLYIISDPNCPYCKDELDRIEQRLQTHNVKMIPVGILHETSMSKAEDIYKASAKLTTNEQKISALRKVYAPNYTSNTTPTQTTIAITNLIRQSGINSVPYKFETAE